MYSPQITRDLRSLWLSCLAMKKATENEEAIPWRSRHWHFSFDHVLYVVKNHGIRKGARILKDMAAFLRHRRQIVTLSTYDRGTHWAEVVCNLLPRKDRLQHIDHWTWFRMVDGMGIYGYALRGIKPRELWRLSKISKISQYIVLRYGWESVRNTERISEACRRYPGTAKRLAWERVHGRAPKDSRVFWLPSECIERLPMKIFLKIWNGLGEDKNDHDAIATANIAIVWKGNWQQWTGLFRSIHDAGINLNTNMSPEAKDYLWRHRKTEQLADLIRICSNWEAIKDLAIKQGLDIAFLGTKEVIAFASSLTYDGVKSYELARECAKWSINQDDFEDIQCVWLSRQLDRESIPYVEATSENGEFRIYKLSRDDVRGLFLGHYTDCCQHPTGAGSSCAQHGAESPDGGFFVVERHGKIIAMSWAWTAVVKERKILVFDNVEVLGSNYLDEIEQMYRSISSKLIGRLCVSEVRVGISSYDDLSAGERFQHCEYPVTTPDGCYTDARKQALIAGEGVSQ